MLWLRHTRTKMRFYRGRVVLVTTLLFLFALFLPVPSYSQDEISYLIIDKTKTPWGHLFYKKFSEIWQPIEGIPYYLIIIGEEKPSRRSSWVYVRVGDNIYNYEVFKFLMKPTTNDSELTRYAIMASKRVLKFLLTDYLRIKELEKRL